MAEKLRTFIAFKLDPQVALLAGRLQRRLTNEALTLRWVKPERIHLTLKFLGDITRRDVDRVSDVMTTVGRGVASLAVTVQGLGAFPRPSRARVVWMGLDGDLPPLRRLHAELDAALARLGFAPEKRAFNAHLTLGRVKGRRPPPDLAKALERHGRFEPVAVTLDHLVLFQSVLRPSGPRYTPLADIVLAGRY